MPEVIANRDGNPLNILGKDRNEAMQHIEEFVNMIQKIRKDRQGKYLAHLSFPISEKLS